MKAKILIFTLLTLVLCCCNPKGTLEEQGNKLVEKIESYKNKNGFLPNSLKNLGLEEKMDGPLYYWKVDSVNYMVWYGTSLGESMTYYSDTKEWDYRQRGMGKNK